MKDFWEYTSKGIVRKISLNKERAKSLIEDSEKRHFFFKQIIEKIEINDNNANYIIEQVYDILIGLIRAKMFFDGYEASGNYAHEAEVSYTKEINFLESERDTMNNIKKSLSLPHLKRCGLCGTSGCSEKDSFKETVSSLKAGVYFSDIRKFRNGIKYYGRRYTKNEAEKSVKFMNSMLPKLKNLLKNEDG